MTSYLVYSTGALKWNRKIQCGNSCRRISFPLCLVWERHPTPSFWQYTPVCQQQFLDKSSAQHEIICFFIDQYSAVSDNSFSTYCTVFLKLCYCDIVAFRPKINGWQFGHWLTANFTFSAVTWKNIVWSFTMPLWCTKHLPEQSASVIITFEFLVGVFVSTRTLSVFLGLGKVVLVFEIIYLFSTCKLSSMVKWLR